MKANPNAMSSRFAATAPRAINSGEKPIEAQNRGKSGNLSSPEQPKAHLGPAGLSLLVKRCIDIVGSSLCPHPGSTFAGLHCYRGKAHL